MKNRAKITALCNQKGGVGKTVTAVNLGIGLAREGKRVLLTDVDPQGSLTASLGYQRPDQMENTLAEILGRIISDEPQAPGEGIIHHAEGVDLLPANIELSGLEVTLVNTMSRETMPFPRTRHTLYWQEAVLYQSTPTGKSENLRFSGIARPLQGALFY